MGTSKNLILYAINKSLFFLRSWCLIDCSDISTEFTPLSPSLPAAQQAGILFFASLRKTQDDSGGAQYDKNGFLEMSDY